MNLSHLSTGMHFNRRNSGVNFPKCYHWATSTGFPQIVSLSSTYLWNGLSGLPTQAPVEWKRKFQNGLTNQKSTQNRNSILLKKKTRIIMWNLVPVLFPISFTGCKNEIGRWNEHMKTSNIKSNLGGLWYKHVVKATPIAHCSSFHVQSWVPCDSCTDLTAAESTVRTFSMQ